MAPASASARNAGRTSSITGRVGGDPRTARGACPGRRHREAARALPANRRRQPAGACVVEPGATRCAPELVGDHREEAVADRTVAADIRAPSRSSRRAPGTTAPARTAPPAEEDRLEPQDRGDGRGRGQRPPELQCCRPQDVDLGVDGSASEPSLSIRTSAVLARSSGMAAIRARTSSSTIRVTERAIPAARAPTPPPRRRSPDAPGLDEEVDEHHTLSVSRFS